MAVGHRNAGPLGPFRISQASAKTRVYEATSGLDRGSVVN
jgi:hypothetical protein